jgi:alkylation response protein AidB-like acyl-CoA dehydrogenase
MNDATRDEDRAAEIASAAKAWFERNWDPELTLGEWWHRLAVSGYGFPTWPVDRYGLGIDPHDAPLIHAARRAVGALGPPAGIAPNLAGPTLIAHGTSEQQDRFLPGIVHGEVWCQLFSEPGSGSDLASLQTRAVRDGDQWIVNGQKVWTSGAHIARYGILVARTDPTVPKHRGLTYFVIDMDQPGIEVRPIREITGRAIFNEVFLTDAVVPVENTIDAVGSGWGVALTTLANERTMLGAGSFGSSGGGMSITKPDRRSPRRRPRSRHRADDGHACGRGRSAPSRARRTVRQGRRPLIRQEYATIHSLLEIARYTDLRVKAAVERGGRPGPEVSIGKLAASHLLRSLRETMYRVCGADATLWGGDAPLGGRMHDVGFSSYLISIGGGTDQIQRNIIGERVLGLPGEPRVDKDVSFSDLLVGTQRPPTG